MVAIDRVGHVYPSVHLQEMLKLAQKPAPLQTPTQYTSTMLNDPVASVMNGDATQKISPSQFGLANNPSLQFTTPGGGFVQVFGPLKTPGNDKFFHDPDPVIIQKKSKPITYIQKINLAYYKPPAPPAPGPVIIKEVRMRKKRSLPRRIYIYKLQGSSSSSTRSTTAFCSYSTASTTRPGTPSHSWSTTTTTKTNSSKSIFPLMKNVANEFLFRQLI